MAEKKKRPRPRKRTYKTGAITKVGRRWRYRWRVNGRRFSATAATRELAEIGLAGKVGEAARGEVNLKPDPRSVPTLGKLVPAWLEAREGTHRSTRTDRNRWENHLEPVIGQLRPDELDASTLRRLAVDRLGRGLSTATVQRLMRLLSTLYTDLVDDGHATTNPVRALPKKTRRLFKPSHDPRTTPFVEKQSDIGRIFLALPEPINVAYAIGALAGLRTGEVLGLRCPHVDLVRRRIHVRESAEGRLKDDESRIVPLLDALAPILAAWMQRLGNRGGLVIPPLRARAAHLDPHTVGKVFADALAKLDPPIGELTWYQATRHTFASHWVMSGGSLEQLREILGHSSITTTERYAHLRPEMFGEAEHGRLLGAMAKASTKPDLGPTLGPKRLRGLRLRPTEVVEN